MNVIPLVGDGSDLCIIYGLSVTGTDEIRYVGQTSKGAKGRYKPSAASDNRPVSTWIRKHGYENITLTVLTVCTLEELEQQEIYWIEEKNTYYGDNPRGLNCTRGGFANRGQHHPDELKEVLRQKRIEQWQNPEYRAFKSASAASKWDIPEYRARVTELVGEINRTPERRALSSQTAGLVNHTRWHVKRNKLNENCSHCNKQREQFVSIESTN